MFLKKQNSKISLFANSIVVFSVLSASAMASGSKLPYVEEVKLNLGNPQAILGLKNTSTSGKLSDFKLGMVNSHIVFAGLSGKLVCGDHGKVARGSPTKATQPNGKPVLRYGFVNEVVKSSLYSVNESEFTLDIYHRKGAAKWRGHKKVANGNGPYSFKIPVSKLKQPGKETSLDVVQYFNNRMQEYIDNGGNKIEFLRKDQLFVVPAFLTLEAGCFSQMHHAAYDVKQVSIALNYKGDKSLKYSTAVSTGDNEMIQLPLQVKDVDIAVKPANSAGQCPRKVPATAKVKFNQSPEKKRNYKIRFLENGVPVTNWQSHSLKGKDWAIHTHLISVEKKKEEQEKKPLGKKAPTKGQTIVFNTPKQIQGKSTVGIEVKADGSSKKIAVAHYVANCTPPKKGIAGLLLNEKPDLTSREGIRIGQKSSVWGGSLALEMSDFINVTPRGCRARFSYDVVNIGKVKASGFMSRLRKSAQSVHVKSGMTLDKNSGTKVGGSVLLTQGTYPMTASIDDGKSVAEIKEDNNLFKIMVSVPKECGGGKPRPQ